MDNESRARTIKALSKSVGELSLSSHKAGDTIGETIQVVLERIRWLAREIKEGKDD